MAIKAQGSTLQVDVSVAGTPDVEIANLKSFSGFDGEAGDLDVSNLSSTAKEFDVGLIDNGSFTVEWHPDFSDSGQNAVRAAETSGALKTFLLTLPNGVEVLFSGRVKNASSMSGGIDGVVEGSANIKISGGITVTP